MGLLDFASDPQGMQGLALLAAAGPSMVPQNFASRLASAGDTYRGLLSDQLKQQYTKAQIDDMTQQRDLRGLQLQQAQQEWALQQPLLASIVNRLQGRQGAAPGMTAPSQPAIAASTGNPLGSGTFGIPVGGQAASAPAPGGGASSFGAGSGGSILPGVPDDITAMNVAAGGIKAIPTLLNEYNKPTDFQKLLTAAHIDPASAEGVSALRKQLDKLNNIPLVAGRAGAPMYNPDGTIAAMAPKIPDNAIPQIVNGRVTGVSALPGAAQVEQINAYAGAAGKAQTKPVTAYRGNQSVFTNELAAAQGGDPFAGLPGAQAGAAGAFSGKPEDVIAAIADMKDPQERANALSAFTQQMKQGGGQLAPQPALGAQQGAQLSQDELSKKWSTLSQANSEAQNTRSYLDNIKQMASRAATGPFTNRLQFANALLAGVGSERAMDATTANNLLDKYSNQIVTRLGTGGLGTDAARSILQSAYPNAHMTVDAINEAADNLKGAQSMVQTKTRLLQQAANARDPGKYSQIETAFDQAADPRIWQLSEMAPAQQAAYVKTLPPAVAADLLKRRQTLRGLGAF